MTILKHGQMIDDKYEAKCTRCGCEFAYSANDIRHDLLDPTVGKVSCPECSHRMEAIPYNIEQAYKK